jgi:beta-xylosidase
VPVIWKDGWPVLGVDNHAPDSLQLPYSKGLIPGIVRSDEFNDNKLGLIWQWNHNPNNQLWSLTKRVGYLRLSTGRLGTSLLSARNTLTQRTFGPICSAATALDVSNMREGDCAGLALLQARFGWVGIKCANGLKLIVMISAQSGVPVETVQTPLSGNTIYLKVSCDYRNGTDKASFFYSLDGQKWKAIGPPLQMSYTIPHFMGYRFGLFNYATKATGGYADYDFFHINDKL